MLGVRAKLYPWIERGCWRLGGCVRTSHGSGAGIPRGFVCSGNICRSPYAEAAARRCGLTAISCGIATEKGLPADGTAITEAAQRGLDLTSHRTTRWQDVEIRTATSLWRCIAARPYGAAQGDGARLPGHHAQLAAAAEVRADPRSLRQPRDQFRRVST